MKEPKNIVESMFLEEKKQSSEYNSNCPCAKGWTQQELADRMGCQVQTINKIKCQVFA
jgi:ribosome-binding protein aMBF1 (putative translation factor)